MFPFRHPNLELVKGDACDVESFIAALKGKDAVISCLGVFASIFNPTTFYSESMFAILDAMKRYIYSPHHREHTLLLNRKRVNKGMKRTNSLSLSPVVPTRPYCRENRYLQVLRSTVALNSNLGSSALCKFFFLLYV